MYKYHLLFSVHRGEHDKYLDHGVSMFYGDLDRLNITRLALRTSRLR